MPPEHPEPALVEYRPLSGWAIVALLIGLSSAVAVIHPLLWIVPLVGVVIAAVALVRMKQSEMPQLGRTPALIGLALSLIFGAAAPTHWFSRNQWLKARAERLGDEFFADLKAGHPEKAFDLSLRSAEKGRSPRRAKEETSAAAAAQPGSPQDGDEKPPAPTPARTALEEFLTEQPVSKLIALGDRLVARRVRTDIIPSELLRQEVAIRYEVSGGESSGKPLGIVLFVRQMIDPGLPERWVISIVTVPVKTGAG